MKCHTNVNSTPPTQLPHKFSYIVAILIHNHFKSPNTSLKFYLTRKYALVEFVPNKIYKQMKESNIYKLFLV
jgi:hypothetical protein